MILILVGLCLILLIIGTYTDIKTREVPDWVNYSGIFAGFGLRLLWSAVEYTSQYIIDGIIGFVIFFILAYILYRFGQWGGGDAKMFMALGVLIGFPLAWDNFAIALLINIAIIGGIYGLIWSFILALKNWKKFKKEFSKMMQNHKLFRLVPLAFIVAIALASFVLVVNPVFFTLVIVILLFIPLMFYMSLMIRAVEKICMYANTPVEKLTEGDWISKNVKVKGKIICSPKDLGVTKKQIRLLKKLKIKKVLIKIGIPFVPSFLLAFLLTLLIGNPLVYLI